MIGDRSVNGSLSRRIAKRFYVRQPFCPWVLRRIRPAAPLGELRQWVWRVMRFGLADIVKRTIVNPQERLRFLVRKTMGGFQLGNADVLLWASGTPTLDIIGDQRRLQRRLRQELSAYLMISRFGDAQSRFGDPDPALAAFSALFYEAKGQQGVDVIERLDGFRIEIPSRGSIGDRDRLAPNPGPFTEIAYMLVSPAKIDGREIGGAGLSRYSR